MPVGPVDKRDGLYTAEDHDEYCSSEGVEFEGVEEGSDAWWAIRKGRAQEAFDIISHSIERGNELAAVKEDAGRRAQPMATFSDGLSPMTRSSAASSVKAESVGSESEVNLRGGAFPSEHCGKDLAKERRDRKRIRRREVLDVVDEEDVLMDTVAEERGCGGGGEAFFSKRLSVSAGEGVVEEEGFEVIDSTGPVGTNGRERKDSRHFAVAGKGGDHHQDQAIASSNKNGKTRRLRSFVGKFLPSSFTKPSSAASGGSHNSKMENKTDESRRRLSSKYPPIPPARGSSSRAGGIFAHRDKSITDKEDQARSSTDEASQTSSWSMLDGDSDIVKTTTNTSDTSVASTSDYENTAETKPPVSTTHDDNLDTATAQASASDTAASNVEASKSNEADNATAAEPEVIDYASMMAEAGDYFFDPYGTESRSKGKEKAVEEDPSHRYHTVDHLQPPPTFPWLEKPPAWFRYPYHLYPENYEEEQRSVSKDEYRGLMRNAEDQAARYRRQSDRLRQRQRLPPLGQRGPPPVPEERRHRAGQTAAAVTAASSNGGIWGGRRELEIRTASAGGVPDIFGSNDGRGNDNSRGFPAGGGRNRAVSYAEMMINAKRNQAARELAAAEAAAAMQARKKTRFSLSAIPDIPKGFGRLVGRVVGHGGGQQENKVVEEEGEEEGEECQGGEGVRGVVEHEEDVGRVDSGVSSNRAVRGSGEEEGEEMVVIRGGRIWG
ncbi:hypothetical protein QBC41DRAFT_213711 [Cercophora samala]|uniref:Uncharacterized protein n=1 Tax=Cercophora samala TaxID=330535 RepID=A0AA40DHR7_9PEZI|nr:hypothetical protein QBC41DRAFT_213711 [Cercophora samala]